MNSDLNSDLEQCTESKLSRVHQVHTLAQPVRTGPAHYAQAARTAPAGHRVVESAGPCRGPLPSRVASLDGRVAGLVDRVAGCIATHPAPRPCAHAVSRAAVRVAASSVVSWRTVAVSQPVS